MVSEYLPIKVVLPDANRRQPNTPGGTAPKMFGEVTPAVRARLATQITAVANAFETAFVERPNVPGVARVRLKADALAKSHRPEQFLDRSCPIIGAGNPGELFVAVTPRALESLRSDVERANTHLAEASISTIESISAYSLDDRVRDADPEIGGRQAPYKVKLFDYQNDDLNEVIRRDYVTYLAGLGMRATDLAYASDLNLLIVEPTDQAGAVADLRRVASHPGVRAASVVPDYVPLRHLALPVPGVQVAFPAPVPGEDYPIIAIVDSGIDTACTPLQPWIVGAERFVTPAETDSRHGTFVAGLTAFGEPINGALVANLGGPCRVLDVHVIPSAAGRLSEDMLVAALQDVVPRYAERVKVWNLSLGSSSVCEEESFSDIAHALDELQAAHGVQFVIAAGNFLGAPRPWPPVLPLNGADRICPPADSVLGLTVGSIAHAEALGSVVRLNEPSPFSRRGPGPAYVIKPELVNYGGNCDNGWGYQGTGIRSVEPNGGIAEDVGTSFSTPLTAALLANLMHEVRPNASMNLARALIIHSADHQHIQANADIEYFGFGRPQGLTRVLHATPSSATLIFEDVLQPGSHYDLDPFPFPACLMQAGTSRGTIKMTLVYTPPLDPTFGMEYCRANVDVHLGTYRVNRRTGEMTFSSRVPLDPQMGGPAYESDLIKHGHKWAPVKSYRGSFSRIASQRWRLMVDMLHRAGETPAPLSFALVITISGERNDPVYDDVVAALRTQGIATQDLALRSEIRQRLQGSN